MDENCVRCPMCESETFKDGGRRNMAWVNTGFQRTLHLFLVLHGVRDADLFDAPKVENIGAVSLNFTTNRELYC